MLLPLLATTAGLLLIMRLPSGTAAAEFASLGVFLGAVFIGPVVLIVNGLLAWGNHASQQACFLRGMIFPGLLLLTALSYQLGLLDPIL